MIKSIQNNKYLCTILCIFALSMHIFAAGKTTEESWYLKYNGKEQPSCADSGRYSKLYNAIALDRSGEKTIYLTFDAGYENGNVEKTLDILNENNVPGAFFVLPNIIKTCPALIQRMRDEGHLICNHTKSHNNMSKIVDFEIFKSELFDNEKILYDETGLKMDKYYRAPEGKYSELNLEFADNLGYKTVFWSLAYADWDNNKQINNDKALNLLLSRTHPGCILLLHPTSKTNSEILDTYIKTLKNDGYTFKSIKDFPYEK